MIGFDPLYIVFVMPAFLLGLWAQIKVKSSFAHAKTLRAGYGLSGAETARRILDSYGLRSVGVEQSYGHLSDHYDPGAKMLRLSPDVFHGRSLAALGIAAHEAGHAIQDATRYAPLVIRNGIVPLASFGSNFSFILIFLGMLLGAFNLVLLGVAAFSLIVLFQLVNLPVEFDASSRARSILVERGMISRAEEKEVGKVLNAAALTYVAATISAIMTLLYYMVRLGVIGGRRD
jgi:uncharacterized protein